jgi:hypothetical protein
MVHPAAWCKAEITKHLPEKLLAASPAGLCLSCYYVTEYSGNAACLLCCLAITSLAWLHAVLLGWGKWSLTLAHRLLHRVKMQ